VFENMALRRIFGCKKGEVIESDRKLHNDNHHKFYSSPYVVGMFRLERM
jgi:hypothetical protein